MDTIPSIAKLAVRSSIESYTVPRIELCSHSNTQVVLSMTEKLQPRLRFGSARQLRSDTTSSSFCPAPNQNNVPRLLTLLKVLA